MQHTGPRKSLSLWERWQCEALTERARPCIDLERKESLMADNTFNFDLDAPAVPTLTLDPVEAPAAEEKQPEPAAAPEAEQVKLSPEEQAMVDSFAQKIDITNSQQVLQYGSACQKKIGDFSEAALSKVSTKDLGEVGGMITDLIGELKGILRVRKVSVRIIIWYGGQ